MSSGEGVHQQVLSNVEKIFSIKGTVNVNLSDPPCKDGIVRFITAPLQTFSDRL